MKKLLNIGGFVLLMTYLVVSLSFSAGKEGELLCSELRIIMVDTLRSGFLNKADVEAIVLGEEERILGYPVKAVNTRT